MTWTKLPLKPLKLAFTISLASLGLMPVQASRLPLILVQHPPLYLKQNAYSNPSTQSQGTPSPTVPRGTSARDLTFEQPPPGQGAPAPGTTDPGGSRGCLSVVQKPLTALVPVTKEAGNQELRWGLTTKEHPTFWFYVPYESKSIRSAKFSLRDRATKTVYETTITLTGTPGVISISLPSTAPGLEINQWYRSYLFVDISCPDGLLNKDDAGAWVKREVLAPILKNELDQAKTPVQQAMFYAKHGFWYEAVTTVAQLHRTNSQDDEWTMLLQSVGLNAIASSPIVKCCTLEQ